MNTTDVVAGLLELNSMLLDKMGKRSYLEPNLTVNTTSTPFSIHWYPHDITERVDVSGLTAEDVFDKAQRLIRAMPDPEVAEIWAFQKRLADVIDTAPPQIDTTILSEFNTAISENLLTC